MTDRFDRRDFLAASAVSLAALGAGALAARKVQLTNVKEAQPAKPHFAARPVSSGSAEPAAKIILPDPTRPDGLFLTWQRDPTTTMTVQWIGPQAAAEKFPVYYASTAVGKGWHAAATRARPYPRTNLSIFRAELTGLKPGMEYSFRIGPLPATHHFRTMPATATDSFQFVSGGDCNVNGHAVANNILAAKQDPMFALIGGDLAYDNGEKAEQSLGFLRNYSRHMVDRQGRLIPLVACLGNHEVKYGYGQTRDKAPFFFAAHDGLFAERSYAALDFGDYLSLILLDTGHISKIDGEQTSWLDKTLAARADRPHLFVVNHVPAYPSFRTFDEHKLEPSTGALNRKHWVPLFERHNVDVVLEHHDHAFKRTHPLKDGVPDAGGVLYLGDGSWGMLRNPKTPNERPYLASTSKDYHFSLHRLEGEQRFHMALAEGGRVADICLTRKRPRHRIGKS